MLDISDERELGGDDEGEIMLTSSLLVGQISTDHLSALPVRLDLPSPVLAELTGQ